MGLLFFLSEPILKKFKAKFPWFSIKMMKNLYWWHMLFALIYYIYTLGGRSDSYGYYERPQYKYDIWFGAYDAGTSFIDFVGYPFINYLFFSFEMMMVLFAWLGYLGFVYFYIVFKENIKFKHKFQGYDLITLFIFLMFDQIMAFAGLDSENLVESFDQFSSHRSTELAKAGSGIDTSNYPLLLKLFTFWY